MLNAPPALPPDASRRGEAGEVGDVEKRQIAHGTREILANFDYVVKSVKLLNGGVRRRRGKEACQQQPWHDASEGKQRG